MHAPARTVYEKVRNRRTLVSQACVIAYDVREDGARGLLGLDVGWLKMFKSLNACRHH